MYIWRSGGILVFNTLFKCNNDFQQCMKTDGLEREVIALTEAIFDHCQDVYSYDKCMRCRLITLMVMNVFEPPHAREDGEGQTYET